MTASGDEATMALSFALYQKEIEMKRIEDMSTAEYANFIERFRSMGQEDFSEGVTFGEAWQQVADELGYSPQSAEPFDCLTVYEARDLWEAGWKEASPVKWEWDTFQYPDGEVDYRCTILSASVENPREFVISRVLGPDNYLTHAHQIEIE